MANTSSRVILYKYICYILVIWINIIENKLWSLSVVQWFNECKLCMVSLVVELKLVFRSPCLPYRIRKALYIDEAEMGTLFKNFMPMKMFSLRIFRNLEFYKFYEIHNQLSWLIVWCLTFQFECKEYQEALAILDLVEPSTLSSINRRMSFNFNHSFAEPDPVTTNKSVRFLFSKGS